MSDATLTLYQRMDGPRTLPPAVEEFYRRVLADPLLEPFFQGVDIERLKENQRAFLTSAFDGPGDASGQDLASVHHRRGIEREHLSAWVGHLAAALEQQGVGASEIDEAIARIATFDQSITGQPNVDG